MCSTTNNNDGSCDRVRELIAWYPTEVLDQNERRLVDAHIAECADCAGMLEFTSGFKASLFENISEHPDAETLVSFIEDRNAVDSDQRAAIELHVELCPECRELAAKLREVEDALTDHTGPALRHPSAARERPRRLWDIIIGGIFKPVPAAVYLVIAVAAVGALVLRPGGDGVPGVVDRAVVLPDETDHVRGLSGEETEFTRIDAARQQFLLLELTGLEVPPQADAEYMVAINEEETGDAAFRTAVKGSVFAGSYTIYLLLPAGTLEPGNYAVAVTAPDRSVVFRSKLAAD